MNRCLRIAYSLLSCAFVPGILLSQVASQERVGGDAHPTVRAPLSAALTSPNDPTRRAAIEEVGRQRQAVVRTLILFVDDKQAREQSPLVVGEAIELLGELRAVEAVDVLAQNIGFLAIPGGLIIHPPQPKEVPAVGALAKIGPAAVPVLLSIVATEQESVGRRRLACNSLREMDGWQITVVRLRLAAEGEREPGRRQRVLDEAKRIEDLWSSAPGARSSQEGLREGANANVPPTIPALPLPSALTSLDAGVRGAATEQLRSHYRALVRTLTLFVDDKRAREEHPAAVADAMTLLGELRAADAVDVLAENMTFTLAVPFRLLGLQDYPAAYALAQIGPPAAPVLLSVIATEGESVQRTRLACNCLRQMDGWQITVLRLRLAAEKEQEPERRDRLLAEAKRIEDIWSSTPPTR